MIFLFFLQYIYNTKEIDLRSSNLRFVQSETSDIFNDEDFAILQMSFTNEENLNNLICEQKQMNIHKKFQFRKKKIQKYIVFLHENHRSHIRYEYFKCNPKSYDNESTNEEILQSFGLKDTKKKVIIVSASISSLLLHEFLRLINFQALHAICNGDSFHICKTIILIRLFCPCFLYIRLNTSELQISTFPEFQKMDLFHLSVTELDSSIFYEFLKINAEKKILSYSLSSKKQITPNLMKLRLNDSCEYLNVKCMANDSNNDLHSMYSVIVPRQNNRFVFHSNTNNIILASEKQTTFVILILSILDDVFLYDFFSKCVSISRLSLKLHTMRNRPAFLMFDGLQKLNQIDFTVIQPYIGTKFNIDLFVNYNYLTVESFIDIKFMENMQKPCFFHDSPISTSACALTNHADNNYIFPCKSSFQTDQSPLDKFISQSINPTYSQSDNRSDFDRLSPHELASRLPWCCEEDQNQMEFSTNRYEKDNQSVYHSFHYDQQYKDGSVRSKQQRRTNKMPQLPVHSTTTYQNVRNEPCTSRDNVLPSCSSSSIDRKICHSDVSSSSDVCEFFHHSQDISALLQFQQHTFTQFKKIIDISTSEKFRLTAVNNWKEWIFIEQKSKIKALFIVAPIKFPLVSSLKSPLLHSIEHFSIKMPYNNIHLIRLPTSNLQILRISISPGTNDTLNAFNIFCDNNLQHTNNLHFLVIKQSVKFDIMPLAKYKFNHLIHLKLCLAGYYTEEEQKKIRSELYAAFQSNILKEFFVSFNE